MKKVIIYSTPTCHYCEKAKEFFAENKIKYTTYDVSKDMEKRKEMMDKSGQLGVPVIMVDKEVLVGFQKDELSRLLGLYD